MKYDCRDQFKDVEFRLESNYKGIGNSWKRGSKLPYYAHYWSTTLNKLVVVLKEPTLVKENHSYDI